MCNATRIRGWGESESESKWVCENCWTLSNGFTKNQTLYVLVMSWYSKSVEKTQIFYTPQH